MKLPQLPQRKPKTRGQPGTSLIPAASIALLFCGLSVSFIPEAHSAYREFVRDGTLPEIQLEGVSTPPNDPAIAQTTVGQNLIKEISEIARGLEGKKLDLIPWSNAQCAAFIRHIYKLAGIDLPITIEPLDGLPLYQNSPYLASSLSIESPFDGHEIITASLAGNDVGTIIEDPNEVQEGDIIFYHCTYGNWCQQHGRNIITHVEYHDGTNVIGDRSGTVRSSSFQTTFRGKFYAAVRLDYDTLAKEKQTITASFLRKFGVSGLLVLGFGVLIVNHYLDVEDSGDSNW